MNTHTYTYRVAKTLSDGLYYYSYSGWTKQIDHASVLNRKRALEILRLHGGRIVH